MDEKKVAEVMARLQRRRDAIAAAHTPENEARLRYEATARGMTLTKLRDHPEGYTLRVGRTKFEGVSPAEVDALITKLDPDAGE